MKIMKLDLEEMKNSPGEIMPCASKDETRKSKSPPLIIENSRSTTDFVLNVPNPTSPGHTDYLATCSCSPESLGSKLEGSEGAEICLLDCRSPTDYARAHIRGAINVSIPTLVLRRLMSKGNTTVMSFIQNEAFRRKCLTCPIIVYDDQTTIADEQDGDDGDNRPRDLSTPSVELTFSNNQRRNNYVDVGNSLSTTLVTKLLEHGCEAKLLKGGFQSFESRYQQLCTYNGDELGTDSVILGLKNLQIQGSMHIIPPDEDVKLEEVPTPYLANTFPLEVLPYLYLGNATNSSDLDCLRQAGIRYIVNVTSNVPNAYEKDPFFKYLQIPIDDHWSQNLSSFFLKAISFIDEGREKKRGVLVHCLAGVSRSVTVTVAYLMHALSLSMNDAYDVVKRCKPNISPNFNFMGQLLDFEQTLNSQRSKCQCINDSCRRDVLLLRQQCDGDVTDDVGGGCDVGGEALCRCRHNHHPKTYFTTSSSNSSSTSSLSSTERPGSLSPFALLTEDIAPVDLVSEL